MFPVSGDSVQYLICLFGFHGQLRPPPPRLSIGIVSDRPRGREARDEDVTSRHDREGEREGEGEGERGRRDGERREKTNQIQDKEKVVNWRKKQ